MTNKTIYWASKKLEQGKKVRRHVWVAGAYIYLGKNKDIWMDYAFHNFGKEKRPLNFYDISANDWEEIIVE